MDTSKQLNEVLVSNQQQLANTFLPITNRLQERIDQVENLQSLPYYYTSPEFEALSHSTPEKAEAASQSTIKKGEVIKVDVDKDLDVTDKENLQDMSLDLPSEVLSKEAYLYTLDKIKTKNKSIGQFLGAASKKTDKEKQVYESRRKTLAKYKELIVKLEGAQTFLPEKSGEGVGVKRGRGRPTSLVKQKRGRGRPKTKPDAIVYHNPGELLRKLEEYTQAYRAGNNGVKYCVYIR